MHTVHIDFPLVVTCFVVRAWPKGGPSLVSRPTRSSDMQHAFVGGGTKVAMSTGIRNNRANGTHAHASPVTVSCIAPSSTSCLVRCPSGRSVDTNG